MTLKINMTENDYLKFNEYYLEHSKTGKRITTNTRILLPFFLLCILAILITFHADLTLILIIAAISVIISIIWQFIVPKILKHSLKNNLTQTKKDGKLPYSENAVLEFKEDAISETTDNSTLNIKYSEIISAGFTEEYIFLFFDSTRAFTIPRRCVNSEFAIDDFLKNKIDAEKIAIK